MPPDPSLGVVGPLAILGQADEPYGFLERAPQTALYSLAPQDGPMQVMPLSSGAGRLVKDQRGQVYQIDPARGVSCVDGAVVVAPGEQAYRDKHVTVGFCEGKGVMLTDAAFHPADPNVIYIVPVMVTASSGTDFYVAAARLRLLGGGNYTIDALYGSDPKTTAAHEGNDPNVVARDFLPRPDLQHLREIEIDSSGQNVFVLNGYWWNQDNWVLIYDAEQQEPNAVHVWLNDPERGVGDLAGPHAMVVSVTGERMYLVPSGRDPRDANDLTTMVYCFSVERADMRATGLLLDHVISVHCPPPAESLYERFGGLCDGHRSISALTSLAEDPTDGTLYAVGFTSPRLGEDVRWPVLETRFCAAPILAAIGPNDRSAPAVELTGSDLALPLSVVCRPQRRRRHRSRKELSRLADGCLHSPQSADFPPSICMRFVTSPTPKIRALGRGGSSWRISLPIP